MNNRQIEQDNSKETVMAAMKIIGDAVAAVICRIPEFRDDLSKFGLVPTPHRMKNISTDGENFVFNAKNVMEHFKEGGTERIEKEVLHPFIHYLRDDLVNFASSPCKDVMTAIADREVGLVIRKLYGQKAEEKVAWNSDDHELWRFNENRLASCDDYDAISAYEEDVRRRERLLTEACARCYNELYVKADGGKEL